MTPDNPYMPKCTPQAMAVSAFAIKTKWAKRAKAQRQSPLPGSGDTDTRKERLALGTFTYHCKQCDKEHAHSSGYVFTVMYGPETLYFCDVDCCDDWEKALTEFKLKPEPVPDRRAAIAATKAKNEKDDLRT